MEVSLREKPCSMLFLSFYTHVFSGYIHDTPHDYKYRYAAYEDILKAMNSTDRLKKIPKVGNPPIMNSSTVFLTLYLIFKAVSYHLSTTLYIFVLSSQM